jgi:hypothetical protein
MCRKIGIAAVLAAAGLFLINRAGLSSYTATAWNNVRGSFKKQVPLEFEIERLRYQVQQLVPDMKRQLGQIAERMVMVQNLRDELHDTRANLKRQEERILTMTKDLEQGAVAIVYDGNEYSAARVRRQLDNDFASYQHAKAELETREKVLEAEERGLDADREALASFKTQKQEMELELARLEAEVRTTRLAKSQCRFHYDESALAKCKATLAEIRTRLKVEKTAAELEGKYVNDTIPVEKKTKSVKELTHEIRAYFKGNQTPDSKVVTGNK